MPPPSSSSTPSSSTANPHVPANVLAELQKISDEWFNYILHDVANLPREPSLEDVWRNYALVVGLSTRLCKRLMQITSNIPDKRKNIAVNATTENNSATSKSEGAVTVTESKAKEAEEILHGAAVHAQHIRFILFSNVCRAIPPPDLADTAPPKNLPEIVLLPSDYLFECSKVAPGYHGWIFVFRRGLEKKFLSAHHFRLMYERASGQQTFLGVYQAARWPEADLTGPEFLALDINIRLAMAAQISNGTIDSTAFNFMYRDLAESRKSITCISLRCLQSCGAGVDQDLIDMPDIATRLRNLTAKHTRSKDKDAVPARIGVSHSTDKPANNNGTSIAGSAPHITERAPSLPPGIASHLRYVHPDIYVSPVPYQMNINPAIQGRHERMSRFDASIGGYTPSSGSLVPGFFHPIDAHGQFPPGSQIYDHGVVTAYDTRYGVPTPVQLYPHQDAPRPQPQAVPGPSYHPAPGDFGYARHNQMAGIGRGNVSRNGVNPPYPYGRHPPDRDQNPTRHWAPCPTRTPLRITDPQGRGQDMTPIPITRSEEMTSRLQASSSRLAYRFHAPTQNCGRRP